MNTIPEAAFDRPVEGLNLVEGRLRDQIGDERPTLLVFLRHFG